MTRKPKRHEENSDNHRPLFTMPEWAIWLLAWIALLVAPQSSNIFQFVASAQSAYGELRFEVSDQMIIVAKNSGTGAVKFSTASIVKHFCLGISSNTAFIPTTVGLIPPATYSVALLPRDGSSSPRMIIADGEAEVPAGKLRLMTPVEDMQYGFGAIIVVAMLVRVCLLLHEWHIRDGFSMTGRRSIDPGSRSR
ncbi:MAG: hypothetical protein ACXW4P_22065 [Thermoanaerobaculia bacterium]